MKLKFEKVQYVSQAELDLLMTRQRLKNWMMLLNELREVLKFDSSTTLLITSIDYHSNTPILRTKSEPRSSHEDSKAVDVTIMRRKSRKGKKVIEFPVPLNRNMVFLAALLYLWRKYKAQGKALPFVGVEADHLHAEIQRPEGVYYYTEVRPLLDRVARFFQNAPFLRLLDQRKIVALDTLF